jgi:hypothetical protein
VTKKKTEEEVNAVSEQWHCAKMTTGQRTDIKGICGYGQWNNICSKY